MVHIRVCGPLLHNYKYDVTKKNTIQTEGIQEKARSVQKIKFSMYKTNADAITNLILVYNRDMNYQPANMSFSNQNDNQLSC